MDVLCFCKTDLHGPPSISLPSTRDGAHSVSVAARSSRAAFSQPSNLASAEVEHEEGEVTSKQSPELGARPEKEVRRFTNSMPSLVCSPFTWSKLPSEILGWLVRYT